MTNDRPKRKSMTIDQAAISNMWEMTAIIEMLERKGRCTKQERCDIIEELRGRNPGARQRRILVPDADDTA